MSVLGQSPPLVREVKKKLALGIAGASALMVAGWQLVQSRSESAHPGTDSDPAGPTTDDQTSPKQPSSGPADPDSKGSPVSSEPESGSAEPEPTPGQSPDVPEGATRAELYEIAQEMGIKGRSNMSKTELLQAIKHSA